MLEYRDRAILKLYLYSGIRLSSGCRLRVSDFHQDGDEATIRLHEKGDKRRTIGIHFHAAQAIQEYIDKAGLASGPLFRRRLNSRSQKLGRGAITPWTMNALVNRGARETSWTLSTSAMRAWSQKSFVGNYGHGKIRTESLNQLSRIFFFI